MRRTRSPRGSAPARPERLLRPESTSAVDTNALLAQNKKALLAIMELKAQLARAESRQRAPIAIVGMACRFPGGCATPEQFWELLREGRDAVTEAFPSRWPESLYDANPEAPGRIMARGLGQVEGVADFEPEFFHVSPREAASMDPQHRLLLTVAWEACEDAGLTRELLHGSRTGIFVGAGNNDYGDFELRNPDLGAVSAYAGTGNATSLVAGRLSFFLGTQGPALVVDTACSSSLVAIHQACTSLRLGESELALAGGVNLVLRPNGSVFLSRFGALSPTGRCRAFAEAADGYVRADGCGVIVLKRLEDALRDGDRVLAVIRGSAINHDGRSGGLTVPNGAAQRELLLAALKNAGVEPRSVGYLEAHGTGTPLGDPIEMGAIADVFGGDARREALRVGSVKSNIGHTEAAAGIAGIIKAVLSLQHREIPAHLHFDKPSSRIDWSIPVEVPTSTRPWSGDGPRLAGVSSFGFSGTNAHVILEEAPRQEARHSPRLGTQVLCLSARTEGSLTRLAAAWREQLRRRDSAPLADLCHAAARRRSHHRARLAVLGDSADAIAQALESFAAGAPHPAVVRGDAVLDGMSRTAFVFSGQGSQWLGMGQELLASEPLFQQSLREMDGPFRDEFGWSLEEALRAGEAESQLERTRVAQPVIVAVQLALSDLWRAWGVHPDVTLGHSLGEISAAHVAGVLGRHEALRLACIRGRFMDGATGRGKMAELACSEEQARRYLQGLEAEVAIAALNGAMSTVLAGAPGALESVLQKVASDGIQHRLLRVDYAFHSPQMAEFAAPFRGALGDMKPRAAERDLYSSVLGRAVRGEALTADYWVRNMTDTVRFHEALVALLRDGCRAVVEVSPHPVLLSAIQDTLSREGVDGVAAYSLRRGNPERATLLSNLGALYAAGHPVDWSALYPGLVDHVALPAYPWHARRFWTTVQGPEATTGAAPAVTAPAPDEAAPAAVTSKVWDELVKLAAVARRPRLERHVREQLTGILKLDSGDIPSKRTPLSELGMDSVGAVALSKALALTHEHRFPPTVLFEHPTIEALTGFLAEEFERLHAARGGAAAPGDSAPPRQAPAAPEAAALPVPDSELAILEKLAALEKEFA
uniref:GulE n=1 Tax=Pyxidicoccus fallax TaxID=394095 RepID=A0A097I352_9BACT|nr:GulE [Pyxidicoccus fallax]